MDEWSLFHFSSFAQSCPTLCNPMDCSTPGFPVRHQLWSLLKLMSIESVMPSNYLILCRPLLLLPSVFPNTRVFSNEFFASVGQSNEASASPSVLPVNIQDWFPLRWNGWISLQSKGLSRAVGSQHYNLVLFFVNTSWFLSPVFLIINSIIFFLIFEVIFIYFYYTSNTRAFVLSRVSHFWLFATPWTVPLQAPQSMGFSRQEYWSGMPSPPPQAMPQYT